MAKYLNARTGAVIETASKVAGGDWQPVKETKLKTQKKLSGEKDLETEKK